jgi:hypothetical protein
LAFALGFVAALAALSPETRLAFARQWRRAA